MPQGSLIVRASASSGNIPISGAAVTVYNTMGDNELIASRYTDEDGRTEPIILDAPSREFSEVPDDGGVRPYSVYDVRVQKDGFYEVYSNDVPIFDGILAVLPVNMIPKSAENSDLLKPRLGTVVENTEPGLTERVKE